MNIKRVVLALLFPICSVVTVMSFGQTSTASLVQNSLVGSWLVTVEGEVPTRTLIISEEVPTSEGALLGAKYGMTDQGQGPIEAKMLRVSGQRQLVLLTQAGTKIAATEQADGSFRGTFTLKNGGVKEVGIEKITEAMRQQLAQMAFQKPGPDVPASCAGFFGGWAGTWSLGNYGQQRLWVFGIKPDCTAKVSFRSSDNNDAPKSFSNRKIADGVLTIPCGNNGSCLFEKHGDEVWGRYTDSNSDRNSGSFKKIQ